MTKDQKIKDLIEENDKLKAMTKDTELRAIIYDAFCQDPSCNYYLEDKTREKKYIDLALTRIKEIYKLPSVQEIADYTYGAEEFAQWGGDYLDLAKAISEVLRMNSNG